MTDEFQQSLRVWRDETARREGVELYRVISNRTIDEIVKRRPGNREELLQVFGFKEAKFAKYGNEVLALLAQYAATPDTGIVNTPVSKELPKPVDPLTSGENEPISVGRYLDGVNRTLKTIRVRIRGEVSSVDIRPRYIFFTLKDGTGESMLPCFIWRNEYDLSAVPLAEGLEIIVTGHAEVYKPAGRLSFRTRLIELVGEGALKHAYDELARRLEGEGVFSLDTKRELPQYPEHIGLITSRDGAVISDFLTNLDRFGFHISFTHTSVEGKAALTEILAAFHRMESLNIDVIVLIRGGGSLESLQAFNAEPVIRAIKRSKVPVIAGIGHDQDVPLASRAADALVSTPTAAAHLVGQSWREARERLTRAESRIVLNMGSAIARVRQRVASHTEALGNQVDQLALVRRASLVRILRCVAKYENELQAMGHRLKQLAQSLIMGSDSLGRNLQVRVDEVERMLRVLDPRRVLGLGYSIVRSSRGVVRKMKDIREGDVLSFEVTDGTVSGTMNSISHHKKKSHEQKN